MSKNSLSEQRGQSIILVAVAMMALIIFVAITVDMSAAYYHRRTAQNAADGAALAGARQLAYQVNAGSYSDSAIQVEMNDFGERNGIEDTDGIPANKVNRNVEGWYLDSDGSRLNAMVGSGSVPQRAFGIEAITYITSPTSFGRAVGLDGIPLDAEAAVMLELSCADDCVVPIATHTDTLSKAVAYTGQCFNIWNGVGGGNFGWLNWTWQRYSSERCDPDTGIGCPLPCHHLDCDQVCLAENLDPDLCMSGFIEVGDWAAGVVGVKNANQVQKELDKYLDRPQPFTVVVWDEVNISVGETAPSCNLWDQGGLHYRVAGFARMQLLGYQLPQGDAVGHDGTGCITFGVPPQNGTRITAEFLQWVDGSPGQCKAEYGTVRSPALTR